LCRLRVGQLGISAQRESALAAAYGGMWGWLQQQRLTHRRNRVPPSPRPDLSDAAVRLRVPDPGASGSGGDRRTRHATVAGGGGSWPAPRRWAPRMSRSLSRDVP